MLIAEILKIAYMANKLETSGDRIKRSRDALGMTQEELGAAAGISGSAISQIESGNSKQLRPDNLLKIARKLGKNPEWLITGKGSETPNGTFIEMISALPTDSGQQVLDFIEYRINKAENLIASDKAADYYKMITDFKRDIDNRKSRDTKK